jgi:hypothetical protein
MPLIRQCPAPKVLSRKTPGEGKGGNHGPTHACLYRLALLRRLLDLALELLRDFPLERPDDFPLERSPGWLIPFCVAIWRSTNFENPLGWQFFVCS